MDSSALWQLRNCLLNARCAWNFASLGDTADGVDKGGCHRNNKHDLVLAKRLKSDGNGTEDMTLRAADTC